VYINKWVEWAQRKSPWIALACLAASAVVGVCGGAGVISDRLEDNLTTLLTLIGLVSFAAFIGLPLFRKPGTY
jgi:hypothetical protein